MEIDFAEIRAYLRHIEDLSLPAFAAIPEDGLYMEQVLVFVNESLNFLEKDERLTSFMVNNYVKGKMIPAPEKKKYGKEQIGYLLALTLLKETLSIPDIGTLIDLESGVSSSKERLYKFWAKMEERLYRQGAISLMRQIDGVEQRYKKEAEENVVFASDNAKDAIGYLALRLAVQAQVDKALSEFLIKQIQKQSK